MEKISRKEASSQGLSKYFTGKPCKHGHIDYRYVCDCTCFQCARDKVARYKEKYPHKVKEHRANRVKKYHSCEETRAKAIAESARWVRENKERAREYQRNYHQKNREKRIRQVKDRIAEKRNDPEWVAKERARSAKKKKDNPEAYRSYDRTRRARLKNSEGVHTANDVAKILESQCYKCVYCKKDIRDEYDVDHIIPLAKGGSNWPKNLQCLCPECNGRKWAKCPIDFAQELGMLL